MTLLLLACSEPLPGATDYSDWTDETVEEAYEDGCPSELFRQYDPDPSNGAYDDPYVGADCSGDQLNVDANGIPHFEFEELTPNGLQAKNHSWSVPLFPELTGDQEDVPLLGLIAFTLTGLPIFGPNEGAFPDPYGDPVYNSIVDDCLGHTAQAGEYHNHALLNACIVDEYTDGPSPMLGYSLDGFAIYGPTGCLDADCTEVVEYTSSWQQTGDPTTDAWDNYSYENSDDATKLDRCNGHTGPLGDYHYHATEGFPYVLGCYSG